ncbi:hypothetical protein FNV43_RR23130 [Rhamnella rubrinervis]|uniref:Uncharacterized protein n=1 Tax=Rhamnella rubrinervis TaxID=2594499 RepID=A0A8K0DXE0_9ROSA|nr:hypothetical protein FNV43_RR23130 [Rhamnella rubrinervis]
MLIIWKTIMITNLGRSTELLEGIGFKRFYKSWKTYGRCLKVTECSMMCATRCMLMEQVIVDDKVVTKEQDGQQVEAKESNNEEQDCYCIASITPSEPPKFTRDEASFNHHLHALELTSLKKLCGGVPQDDDFVPRISNSTDAIAI